jgi:repressor LexA
MALTKRQKEIYDFVRDFIATRGYSPSLQEIGANFGLSAVATVHKHVSNLVEKGLLQRGRNQNRSLEVVPTGPPVGVRELPLCGYVAAGQPVEAVAQSERLPVPETLAGKGRTYVLRVRGDSMIDEQIRDGDYVIVEDRKTALDGEMVIALLHGDEVTLKKLYRERGRIRLQPANPDMAAIYVREENLRIQGVVIGLMRRYGGP